MSSYNKAFGKWGEDKAKEFLTNNGYTILKENYRCSLGEIDIIAEKCNAIVFIEVKSRSSTRFGTPGEAVDYRKQQKYYKMALYFIQRHNYFDKDYRFDIIEVYAPSSEEYRINHIVNAFQV